jgi:tetratricopeptide (TPR) repeat protein
MKSIQLKPDFSPAYQHLAECLSSEGRFVEALTYADLLIGRVPYCTGAYYLRGSLHSHLDQDNLAYSDFKTALELGPNNPDTYVQFGGACVGIKEYSEAIEACEKAVKLDPKKAAGCLYRIGLALEKSGNYNKAIDYYQNAKTHSSGIFAKWCDERIFECRNHLK